MKTSLLKESEIERKWYVVNAAGKPLGRMAVKVATLLRGRGKPIFAPSIDTGDFVVVTNARDLYSRWPTLEYQEKRKVTESLTERITIGHGEISIDLCYLPSSPSPEMMAKGQQIATNEHEWTGFVETLIHSRAADHE